MNHRVKQEVLYSQNGKAVGTGQGGEKWETLRLEKRYLTTNYPPPPLLPQKKKRVFAYNSEKESSADCRSYIRVTP